MAIKMGNLRISMGRRGALRCENCGVELSEDNVYVRVINNEEHYFCCSHCADAYEARLRGR